MKKISIFIILLCVLFINKNIYASNKIKSVYVSGGSLGIKLQTEVEVLGTYGIEDNGKLYTPWMDKIYEHDVLLSINGETILDGDFLSKQIEKSCGKSVEIELRRNGILKTVSVIPAMKKEKYSLGLYIKDYELGVGTTSFVEKNSLNFASLGHSMIHKKILGGTVYKARVEEIIKPRENKAGEKKATIIGNAIGKVNSNQENGVYGVLYDDSYISNASIYQLARREEAHEGKAQILTCVEGMNVSSYDIYITDASTQPKKDIKGLRFRVTDEELIAKAGGIVQGMSGSPIIQDGKLIGAVTHVQLSNPTTAFGCYAEFMLDSMGFEIE